MRNHSPSYGSNSVAAASVQLGFGWNLMKTKKKETPLGRIKRRGYVVARRRPAAKMFGGIYNLREAGLPSRICR
jgi:hypothetical protein